MTIRQVSDGNKAINITGIEKSKRKKIMSPKTHLSISKKKEENTAADE